MTSKNITYPALALLAAAAAATALAAPVTQQRSMAAFSAIDISGPYEVVVRAQGAQSVSLSGEQKDLADVDTVMRGTTLVIKPKTQRNPLFNVGKERVTVTIQAPALTSVRSGITGDMRIDQLAAQRFELNADGPGDIMVTGKVRDLVTASSGPGDINLRQLKATNVNLVMDGPGDVDMGAVGGDLTLKLNGPGDLKVEALAGGKVDVRMHGPGDARLAGSSRELRLEMHGPGDFEGCGLAVQNVSAVLRGPGDGCVGGSIKQFNVESHGPGNF